METANDSWFDNCVSYAPDVAQASGIVAGAQAFTTDIGSWAASVAESHNPVVLGMAPEVGSRAGHDAVEAYHDAFTNATQNWSDGCHLIDNFVDPPAAPAYSPFMASTIPDAFAHVPSAWDAMTAAPVSGHTDTVHHDAFAQLASNTHSAQASNSSHESGVASSSHGSGHGHPDSGVHGGMGSV